MRWVIPGALLCAACASSWADKSRQLSAAAASTSEAAKAAGDLARLAEEMPAAIERCREFAGQLKAGTVIQAAYSVSDVADRASRMRCNRDCSFLDEAHAGGRDAARSGVRELGIGGVPSLGSETDSNRGGAAHRVPAS
jgi:hypothetical protein